MVEWKFSVSGSHWHEIRPPFRWIRSYPAVSRSQSCVRQCMAVIDGIGLDDLTWKQPPAGVRCAVVEATSASQRLRHVSLSVRLSVCRASNATTGRETMRNEFRRNGACCCRSHVVICLLFWKRRANRRQQRVAVAEWLPTDAREVIALQRVVQSRKQYTCSLNLYASPNCTRTSVIGDMYSMLGHSDRHQQLTRCNGGAENAGVETRDRPYRQHQLSRSRHRSS